MTERDLELLERARTVYTGEASEKQIISPDILWLGFTEKQDALDEFFAA